MFTALAVAIGYLIGSIPSGVLFARASGVDLRGSGSGNIGATNVARTVGARAGVLTLAADVLKGLLPAYAAQMAGAEAAPVGLATVIGHVYPVFARFRGGKGAATAFGAFLALAPLAVLPALLGFVVVAASTRYVSAASLTAAFVLPVACALIGYGPNVTGAAVVAAVVVGVRHRDNLERLWAGTEPRFRVARR